MYLIRPPPITYGFRRLSRLKMFSERTTLAFIFAYLFVHSFSLAIFENFNFEMTVKLYRVCFAFIFNVSALNNFKIAFNKRNTYTVKISICIVRLLELMKNQYLFGILYIKHYCP